MYLCEALCALASYWEKEGQFSPAISVLSQLSAFLYVCVCAQSFGSSVDVHPMPLESHNPGSDETSPGTPRADLQSQNSVADVPGHPQLIWTKPLRKKKARSHSNLHQNYNWYDWALDQVVI